MSARIERAQAVLQEQLAEIDAEEKDLRQALASLDGAPKGAPQKASRQPTRRRSTKRAKKGQRREEVKAILEANPKAKTSEIARQIGISSNQVSGLRKQILAGGELTQAPAQKLKPKRAKRKAAKTSKKAKAAKPKAKAKAANKKGGAKRGKGASSSKKSPTPKQPKSK